MVGSDALARAEGLTDGDILLLENIRFDPRETSKDDNERLALAGQLAELVAAPDGSPGAFVSDGFGVVHRKQASVYDVATLLPHYAGTLVAAEIEVLEQLTSSTERPYAVVLGGSKVSDKLAVIESLATKADSLVIGGGMCFTFLASQGVSVGTSLLEEGMIDTCRKLLEDYGDVIHLPVDIVVTEKFAADSPPERVPADQIPDGKMGLDIGPGSVKRFTNLLSNAKTIFWNGPMGVFEFPAYADGTKGVAEAIIGATAKGAFSVVGGGDSAAAVRQLGLAEDGFSHISTGGGASLEYLEGKTLPGIEVLEHLRKARHCVPQAADRRQLEDEPQPLRSDRAGAEDRLLAAGQVFRQGRRLGAAPVHRPAQRADPRRRGQAAADLRRTGPVAA